MHNLSEKTLLIIPCYNEENRLEPHKFLSQDKNLYFLFVNDGSSDNTLGKLEKIASERMFILDLKRNVGKGEAIRQGMLYAQTMDIYSQIVWGGYWDADLSTPLSELYKFMQLYSLKDKNIDAVWGSRIHKLGSNIKRSHKRHMLGRLFATAISLVFHVKSYDSQCGAKIFKKQVVEKIFSQPFISKWIFDVELLLRMDKHTIIEHPLENWQDIEGSKIRIRSDALPIMFDLYKIWRATRIASSSYEKQT
jgi:dolichyl-phosphate beta-glucosyltransferase